MYSIPLVVKNMNVLCLIEMLNLKKMFLFWYVSVRLAWDTVIKENVEDCSIYMSDWTEVLFNYAPLCPSHCQCIVTTPTRLNGELCMPHYYSLSMPTVILGCSNTATPWFIFCVWKTFSTKPYLYTVITMYIYTCTVYK